MPQATKSKALFIGHDASRTGAPIVLLHLMRWFRAHRSFEFEAMLRRSGPLVPAYRELCPVFECEEEVNRWHEIRRRVLPRRIIAGAQARRLRQQLMQHGFGVMYVNSIANAPLVQFMDAGRAYVIVHVHEMNGEADRLGRDAVDGLYDMADEFIVVSRAVEHDLRESTDLRGRPVTLIPEPIDIDAAVSSDRAADRRASRKKLGLAEDDFVVGAVGTPCLRKGMDLFGRLPCLFRDGEADRRVRFVWLGGDGDDEMTQTVRRDAKLLGVDDRLLLPGAQVEMSKWYPMFDVLLMCSREDPNPLVCMEAGVNHVPVICFDGAGGTSDLVEGDAGIIVPYLDMQAMAHAIRRLKDDAPRRAVMGEAISRKTHERHGIPTIAARIGDRITPHL